MSLADVPPDRRCNAKTRAGHPCRNWSILPAGRCRLHGGKSYRGFVSPRFRHGWYSQDLMVGVLWKAALRLDPLARPFIEDLVRRERATDTPCTGGDPMDGPAPADGEHPE